MNCVLCPEFPTIKLSPFLLYSSEEERTNKWAELIEFAPDFLRPQVREFVSRHSICSLSEAAERANETAKLICGHAALAELLLPSLSNSFSVVFYQTDPQFHNVLLAALAGAKTEKHKEYLDYFLFDVSCDGFERAFTATIERSNPLIFGNMQWTHKDTPIILNTANALSRILETHHDNYTLMLAAKWLHQLTFSDKERQKVLDEMLVHPNPHVQSVAALILKKKQNPENEKLLDRLWKSFLHCDWDNRCSISIPSYKGTLENTVLDELVYKRSLIDPHQRSEKRKFIERKWLEFRSSTEPANRDLVEENLPRLYKAAGLRAPKAVLWFNNPQSAVLAANSYAKSRSLRAVKSGVEWSVRAGARPWSRVESYFEKLRRLVTPYLTFIGSQDYAFWDSWHHRYLDVLDCLRDSFLTSQDEGMVTIDEEARQKMEYLSQLLQLPISLNSSGANDEFGFKELLLNKSRFNVIARRNFDQEIGAFPQIDDGLEIILGSCLGFIAFDDVIFLVERPLRVMLDSEGRYHNESGPAIEYSDGWGAYVWRNRVVPRDAIMEPQNVTLHRINQTQESFYKLALIEIYGVKRFIAECELKPTHQDEFGELYHTPRSDTGWRRLAFLKLIVPGAEKKESEEKYISVPDFDTTGDALAWVFLIDNNFLDRELEIDNMLQYSKRRWNELVALEISKGSAGENGPEGSDTLIPEEILEKCQQFSSIWSAQMLEARNSDRHLVLESLKLLYKAAGMPPPKEVRWFVNPKAACRAANTYSSAELVKRVSHLTGRPVRKPLSRVEQYISLLEKKVALIEPVDGCQRIWNWTDNPAQRDTSNVLDIISTVQFIDHSSPPHPSLDQIVHLRPGFARGPAWDSVREADALSFRNVLLSRRRIFAVGYRIFLREVGAYPDLEDDDGLESILQNCGGFIAFDDVVFVVERPVNLVRDVQGRIHNEKGMAISYSDGTGFYLLRNVLLPAFAVMQPHLVTLDLINRTSTPSTKFALMQIFGFQRLIDETGIEPYATDEYGALYRYADGQFGLLLEVVNHSPEPDGTFKSFIIPVPYQHSPKAAVAWTFGFAWSDDYHPIVET